MLSLLAELSDYARSIQASTPCSPGHWNCNGCDRYDSLDKAVKTPCTESRLCVWGHTGKGPEACTRPKGNVRGITPEARRHAFQPRVEDLGSPLRHGPHLRADGLLRPIKNMIALDLPGLLPTGETAPSGALRFHISGSMGHVTDASTESHRAVTIPPGPQTSCFIYFKIKLNKMLGRGDRGGECRRCTSGVLLARHLPRHDL